MGFSKATRQGTEGEWGTRCFGPSTHHLVNELVDPLHVVLHPLDARELLERRQCVPRRNGCRRSAST